MTTIHTASISVTAALRTQTSSQIIYSQQSSCGGHLDPFDSVRTIKLHLFRLSLHLSQLFFHGVTVSGHPKETEGTMIYLN